MQDYEYLSTELVYEATLHQDFYSDSNNYKSFLQIEQKMKDRDLNSILYNSENFKNASLQSLQCYSFEQTKSIHLVLGPCYF